MTTLTETATATAVMIRGDRLIVELRDGRTVSAPLTWYPRLAAATPPERREWHLIGNGAGIHWPLVDEDLSIEGLLRGRPSMESENSLRRWRRSAR